MLLLLLSACLWAAPPAGKVTSVAVPGTGLAVKLRTQVGAPYNSADVDRDVRYLWGLGRFDDVRVEAAENRGGVDLVFRVVPSPHIFLHEVRIEPTSYGIQMRLAPMTPMNALAAHQAAEEARKQLESAGYPNAQVAWKLVPVSRDTVNLKLKIDSGEARRVKDVAFEGDNPVRGKLHDLRAQRILFWRLLPSYSEAAVASDAARLRSAYIARGYFDASVWNRVDFRGRDAHVTLGVAPGLRYPLEPGFCHTVLEERRDAQRQGILDFTARLDDEGTLDIERGRSYRVGRIEFRGNHRYSDSAVRRNFPLDEGDLFDETELRRGVARLNRTGWFENIDRKDVIVHPDPETAYADVTIRLVERKIGSWKLSGPAGPMSVGGSLQAAISARLPRFATYTLSLSLFYFAKPIVPILNQPRGFLPVLALERPYTPGAGWKSGFVIAPALGWRMNALSYVVNQFEERMTPLVVGEKAYGTPLDVAVARPRGEVTMTCEAPKPRFGVFRSAGLVTLHLLGAVPAL